MRQRNALWGVSKRQSLGVSAEKFHLREKPEALPKRGFKIEKRKHARRGVRDSEITMAHIREEWRDLESTRLGCKNTGEGKVRIGEGRCLNGGEDQGEGAIAPCVQR